MKWKIVSDEDGTDYATVNEELKFENFPLNSVLKAIDQKREGSLTTISLLNKRDIIEMQNEKK